MISWRIATERNAWRWSFSYLATISNAKHNSPTVLNIARLCAFQGGLGRANLKYLCTINNADEDIEYYQKTKLGYYGRLLEVELPNSEDVNQKVRTCSSSSSDDHHHGHDYLKHLKHCHNN